MNQPYESTQIDQLPVRIYQDTGKLSDHLAAEVAEHLIETIDAQGSAAAILATGNSQIEFLNRLVTYQEIDWGRITLFHMDEYLGLSGDHPSSFRRYMKDRVESLVEPKKFHYMQGDADEPILECDRYEAALRSQPIDLCCMGIGENGHIAFNDPHVANFEDKRLVKVVSLDEACRNQQVKQGHFTDIHSMPQYALTLTITALRMAKRSYCLAPEKRKVAPVTRMLTGSISPECPASILRQTPSATLLLDQDSASGVI